MTFSVPNNLLAGWSTGYNYCENKKEAKEILQGGNYYIAGLSRAVQVVTVANLYNSQRKALFTPMRVKNNTFLYIANIVSSIAIIGIQIASFPIAFYVGAVKKGEYKNLTKTYKRVYTHYSKAWNQRMEGRRIRITLPEKPIPIPEKLGKRTIKTCNFLATHWEKITSIALIVGSIAAIAIGNVAFGAMSLTAVAYEYLDSKGHVPHKISLFMEKYMHLISAVGLFLSGNIILRVVFGGILLSTISNKCNNKVLYVVDSFFRNISFKKKKSPTLKQYDAPLVEKRKLSFEEINTILDRDPSNYEMNPAHCSKKAFQHTELPADRDFAKFLQEFNAINWSEKYQILLPKMKDDDRFIDFLATKFPEEERADLYDNIEDYIQRLADEKEISKEQYAEQWAREQMILFIDGIQGRRHVEGSQRDLADGIENCAKLNPYLQKLKPMEKESALLRLAIEGGAYCGSGVKRASGDLLDEFLQSETINNPAEVEDPCTNYELKIKQALQDRRKALVQKSYQDIFQIFHIDAPNDVHMAEEYSHVLGVGFIPLSAYEKRKINLTQIVNGHLFYAGFREPLYKEYSENFDNPEGVLHQAISEHGEAHFGTYMASMIQGNKDLTKEQKDQLIEKYTERNEDQWTQEETEIRFHNLMYVQLGIIRPKTGL